MKFPVPHSTSGVSFSGEKAGVGSVYQFIKGSNEIVWSIKSFQGLKELVLVGKLSLRTAVEPTTRKEVGPISMSFDIHMFNVSGVTVKSLKIASLSKNYSPHRWVRYVT